MDRKRYLEPFVRDDLGEKMVFLAGPRQVGKTTLARRLLQGEPSGLYLNWDNRDDRREIRESRWPAAPSLVVLDELHKWRQWKGWIKGEFDKHRGRLRFLVTGSARLDLYRRGGDSLQGRYHHYRLHPFSAAEASGSSAPRHIVPGEPLDFAGRGDAGLIASLMEYGGFPEPFLSQSPRTLRRWQKERLDRFFREDVRDLETIRDLASMQEMADLLPERVGSPLSLNVLRENLEVSHRAVTLWINVLERLYHVVRVPPWSSTRVRSLRKMPKAYLWDWSLVPDRAARFENLVALHLLKLCHFLQDSEGHDVELHYLRDRAGHEVDFLVTHRRRPWIAVEVKLSESRLAPELLYFKERLRIPSCYQVVLEGDRDFLKDGVRCLPAARFLAGLV